MMGLTILFKALLWSLGGIAMFTMLLIAFAYYWCNVLLPKELTKYGKEYGFEYEESYRLQYLQKGVNYILNSDLEKTMESKYVSNCKLLRRYDAPSRYHLIIGFKVLANKKLNVDNLIEKYFEMVDCLAKDTADIKKCLELNTEHIEYLKSITHHVPTIYTLYADGRIVAV